MTALAALFRRELAQAWGGGGGAAAPAAFFLAALALSAFALGPDPAAIAQAAPGALALSFALAALLGFEHLFQADLEAGALDQLALGAWPLETVAYAKIIARATATLWPVAALAPLGAVMMGLSTSAALVAGLALALAAPGLAGAGAVAAALAAGRARGGILIAVLAPPFLAPSVIFAAGAILRAGADAPPDEALLLLAATSLFSLAAGGLGAAAALRMQLE